MNDTILLEGLRLECILGDLPHERTFPQELFLDLELTCDELPATRTDALADTVDYVAVAERVRTALIAARCRMIERAAQLAAESAFACAPSPAIPASAPSASPSASPTPSPVSSPASASPARAPEPFPWKPA